nr:GAF domain-containing protein [Kineococcus siccus]
MATDAARALGMPAALISMVDGDRQWFAARRGLGGVIGYDVAQTPREVSFCAHVVAAEHAIAVPDATHDQRFADNALVTGPEHLRAYAGAPILDGDGLPLGALCVLDREPRDLDETALAVLGELAASVSEVLRRHRSPRGGATGGPDRRA